MNYPVNLEFLQREFMMLLEAQCFFEPTLYKPAGSKSLMHPWIEAHYETTQSGFQMIGNIRWDDSSIQISIDIEELKIQLMQKSSFNLIDKMLFRKCHEQRLIRRPFYVDLNRPDLLIEAVALIPKPNNKIQRIPLLSFPWKNEREFWVTGEPALSEAIGINNDLMKELFTKYH